MCGWQSQNSSGQSWSVRAHSKVHLVAMMRVLTGHCAIDTHAVCLKILEDENCQSCMEVGELKTSRHFGKLAGTDISSLDKLRTGSKRFIVMRRSF